MITIPSRGEIKIKDILDESGLIYETEYMFPDLVSSSGRPLRFDFVVFDDDGNIDFLIEYQGEQHYTSVKHFGGNKKLQQQKYNDLQKRKYCLKKNYPLLLIPYWEYNQMDYGYIMSKAEELSLL